MGQFPTDSSYITRAQTWIPTNTINPKSAWLFENQSGSLGTNLTGSVVYVGTAGTVRVIVAGTPNPQISDALEFKNVAAGTILPVVVDYVLIPSNGSAATDIIVGK